MPPRRRVWKKPAGARAYYRGSNVGRIDPASATAAGIRITDVAGARVAFGKASAGMSAMGDLAAGVHARISVRPPAAHRVPEDGS